MEFVVISNICWNLGWWFLTEVVLPYIVTILKSLYIRSVFLSEKKKSTVLAYQLYKSLQLCLDP